MGRKKREFITPELTPLIDVVFLLLIFFLVSSVFKKSDRVLDLNLPVTEKGSASKLKKKEISIEITNDHFAMDGAKLNKSELASKLKNFENTVEISLSADKSTNYERFVSVLELLHLQKKQNISIITTEKKN